MSIEENDGPDVSYLSSLRKLHASSVTGMQQPIGSMEHKHIGSVIGLQALNVDLKKNQFVNKLKAQEPIKALSPPSRRITSSTKKNYKNLKRAYE